jgi:hypothetical protein
MHDSETVVFRSICPNGHDFALPFDRRKLADSLADGSLRFRCNYCGIERPPSDIEKENVRKLLLSEHAKNSADPADSDALRDQLKGQTVEHATPARLEDEGQSGG